MPTITATALRALDRSLFWLSGSGQCGCGCATWVACWRTADGKLVVSTRTPHRN